MTNGKNRMVAVFLMAVLMAGGLFGETISISTTPVKTTTCTVNGHFSTVPTCGGGSSNGTTVATVAIAAGAGVVVWFVVKKLRKKPVVAASTVVARQ